jgi:ATP/maltotriose-dependent transcriptional regulator MalT
MHLKALTKIAPGFDEFAVELSRSTMPESAQFVAREQEVTEMHRLLYSHISRSAVVLHGLGGIGKTQLAIEYARRYKARYTAIFWVSANDQDSIKLSFVDMAQQIIRNHPSARSLASVDLKGNLDNIVDAVKAWLDIPTNTRWLIIYDNYDNPKVSGNPDVAAMDIRRFLPGCDHGSIIVTTRSSQVTVGTRIQVQKLLNIQDGLEILSNTSGRKDIMNGMFLLSFQC